MSFYFFKILGNEKLKLQKKKEERKQTICGLSYIFSSPNGELLKPPCHLLEFSYLGKSYWDLGKAGWVRLILNGLNGSRLILTQLINGLGFDLFIVAVWVRLWVWVRLSPQIAACKCL